MSSLDSGSASYERITWSDKGDALAALKGTDDRAYRDKFYSVVGVTDLASAAPKKVIFDPAADAAVPKGMSISPNRDPLWTDDLEALLFGLYEPRHKDDVDTTADAPADGAPAPADASANADAAGSDEKVDLVLWHYKDPRLQTQQEVQEARDRAYNYVAEYRVQAKKFIRLADESMRNVTLSPKQSRWGFGSDDREYELMGSLDGRRHEDVFAIDLTTGAAQDGHPARPLFHRPVAGRIEAALLRERRLPRVFAGDRPGQEHHPGARGVVRRRRGRSQQRQAAGQRDRLGQRQQDGAADRCLGHLAGLRRTARRR